ncbi:aminotransferase class V-fold PLP-dependent enzyme [Streptomyces olivaceus]|uniref:Aminotransferase class V-fold PLP-dependent enzyme n=1 Tax=Streptomyces olivaceus TaxID=47716 RepID=A0ABS7WEN1_STROV|nr:cysteine desulfurase/sulfurtransferase TusA family protein [Streptomyces olivaceus]MBZ6089276.1 aminotransferase class V-fold PLP-dependent enzyme [Streptomyces olivaceus]MBZ6097414.1 aminotransferase class V-fold PLP-dependent enzyme [Streptomyces olivaceus]MBZ6117818.1 aminotransferase class V-fold PLP-dependent enzyme [Streptomyces olivaceus]MBZ6156421.1 aminotransferase class V-fold PLP-dependent enzyme [Streptomyces olivaceus]MBZ6300769.1 aminotransferase class V-fold PLP-dependent enz
MVYFDAASAAPLHPVARQALLASLDEGWADPARLYREGRRARLLLDAAREAAAEAVGCRPDELVFTPSGTRAVHAGMAGALAGRRRVGGHLIVSAVEHSSVLHAAEAHEAAGGSLTHVPVDRAGAVDPAAYAAALGEDTALACLQSANHEVGTEQPVARVAEVCRAAGVPLLVDAAQSLGWGPVEGDWSLLAGSAHKWGGPSGVGLLVVRKGVRFAPQGPGDERESGRAPGFENLPAVVAAAASLRAVRAEAAAEAGRLRELTERIRARVPLLVPDAEVVGDPEHRLPGVVTFSCLYADGETLLHELDRAGFSVSSGSSCTSSTLTPSHVLKAMGVLSEGNVRVSLPPGTPAEDVERFLEVLPGTVAAVRERLGAPTGPGPGREEGGREEGAREERPREEGGSEERAPEARAGLVVDAIGRRCPIPVIELAKVIGDVPVGGTVRVLADDEAARLDIPAWCEMRGQEYAGEEPAETGTAYLVRRIR